MQSLRAIAELVECSVESRGEVAKDRYVMEFLEDLWRPGGGGCSPEASNQVHAVHAKLVLMQPPILPKAPYTSKKAVSQQCHYSSGDSDSATYKTFQPTACSGVNLLGVVQQTFDVSPACS